MAPRTSKKHDCAADRRFVRHGDFAENSSGNRRLESGPVVAQLATLQDELKHHHDARRNFERYAELSPLLEKGPRRWLAGRLADVTYYLGRYAEAAEYARQVEDPVLYGPFAKQLVQEPFLGKRVKLEVDFVRQHHQTCVPATLAALTRYWKQPVDQRELAHDICYNGTPDHRARAWFEQHGWLVREFSVTWDSAVALIDGGIPFTLTTADPGSAHMQEDIGYDTGRRTLLIRDPSWSWSEPRRPSAARCSTKSATTCTVCPRNAPPGTKTTW